MRIDKKYNVEGQWWTDDSKGDPKFGVLKFHPEKGLKLTLKIPRNATESFFLDSSLRDSEPANGRIYGRDQHGKPITLFGCYRAGGNVSGALTSLTFSALRCVVGDHCSDWNKVRCREVVVSLTLLDNWMADSRIRWKKPNQGETTKYVEVDAAERVVVSLPSGDVITIFGTSGFSHGRGVMEIYEGWKISLLPKTERLDAALCETIEAFRRMLSFFTGRQVFRDEIAFQLDGDLDFKYVLMGNQGIGLADREHMGANMILSYSDLKDVLPDVVASWFSAHKKLGDVLNLYYAVMENNHLYSNQRFLFIAQALEVFHRSSPQFEQRIEPVEQFKQRRKRILEMVQGDDKVWLSGKLDFANEKKLSDRINDLIDSISPFVDKVLGDKKEFADAVRHARNHYTHYSSGKGRRKALPKGVNLLELTDKMILLLQILIANSVNLPEQAIKRLIAYSKKVSYMGLDEAKNSHE